jgi:hypothetical protein
LVVLKLIFAEKTPRFLKECFEALEPFRTTVVTYKVGIEARIMLLRSPFPLKQKNSLWAFKRGDSGRTESATCEPARSGVSGQPRHGGGVDAIQNTGWRERMGVGRDHKVDTGRITGLIENEPFNIPDMHGGQIVEVHEEDVFDYIRQYPDKHREGNTTGEILRKLNEEQGGKPNHAGRDGQTLSQRGSTGCGPD